MSCQRILDTRTRTIALSVYMLVGWPACVAHDRLLHLVLAAWPR